MALALDPHFVVELTARPRRGDMAAVYLRRRVVVASALAVALFLVLGGLLLAGRVMAGRGGVPASVPTAQPVHAPPYVVQPGDNLWSIAERFAGERSVTSYLEALIRVNGGPDLDVGQRLELP